MEDKLTLEEQRTLLRLAREALEYGVRGEPLPPLDSSDFTPRLCEAGASFVTLTEDGQLRGCIGALEPYQPLAEDVREHAVAAALEDPRFFSFFYPPIAVALVVFFLILGLILPLLAQSVSRKPGRGLIAQRADIQTRLVDGIQGIADLLAFRRGRDRAEQIFQAGISYGSAQKQMARISGTHPALGTLFTNLGLCPSWCLSSHRSAKAKSTVSCLGPSR